MDAKPKHRRPKLDRRNAIKNCNYYAPASSLSDEDDQSSSPSGVRTRSLDLYRFTKKQTSFRVIGMDGEFELICRSLGLSGPEDFAIPTAAWEAQKARSSSEFVSSSGRGNQSSLAKLAQSETDNDLPAEFQSRVGLSTECAKQSSSDLAELESRATVTLQSDTVERRGRIRGARPPILTPPPVMVRPVVDNVSSTWDILKSFAPQDSAFSNSPIHDVDVSYSDEKERVIKKDEKVSGGIVEREVLDEARLGETDYGLESCYSGSNCQVKNQEDDDAIVRTSGVIMVCSISPSGTFRRSITSWQKGDLLGSGSFGTVYEGFTE